MLERSFSYLNDIFTDSINNNSNDEEFNNIKEKLKFDKIHEIDFRDIKIEVQGSKSRQIYFDFIESLKKHYDDEYLLDSIRKVSKGCKYIPLYIKEKSERYSKNTPIKFYKYKDNCYLDFTQCHPMQGVFFVVKLVEEIDTNNEFKNSFKVLYKEKNADTKDDKKEVNKMTMEDNIIDLIKNGCRQIIFTGAPGTGKTYVAKRIAEKLGAQFISDSGKGLKYELVQFHPSYDYTDFVEGLRPITIKTDDNKDTVFFAKLDGAFKSFCRKVVKENETDGNNINNLYFFIIDEINRANLSKVFGELMFGLERDKRGKENSFFTQYCNIPAYSLNENDEWKPLVGVNDVFANGFYIPENIVIIGTMNDIDRSVESMDFALRRRFEWKEFVVEKSILKEAFDSGRFGMICKNNSENLAKRIMMLNDFLSKDGKKYCCRANYLRKHQSH